MTLLIWISCICVLSYSIACVSVYMLQEKFVFFPTKLPDDYYYRFPIPFEEFNIPVEGDTTLNALLFKAENSKGCVLYHHGNARSVLDWGGNAYDFVSRGYDVLFYDYRGYGKSDGEIESEAQLMDDSRKVYRWLTTKYSSNKIIQMGRSLGSGVAVQLASEFPTSKLILETPYASVLKIARRTIPFLPVGVLLKYKFLSKKHIKKVSAQIFLIHGTEDSLIPLKHSKTLLKSNNKAELIIIEGGGHNNLPSFDEYQKAFDKILD